MGLLLAFSGKGGSGKTTLSAMVLRQLLRAGVRPVLAVDADPNATLAATLGGDPVPLHRDGDPLPTIADLRDRMGEAAETVTEIPKERLMGQWLAELLSENPGYDLLTMGRPEGPKCYCYVNGLLRRYLKELRGNYAAVVVDCEAGMEHLSRLTVDDVDTLVLVAEATAVGIASARRISQLADSLPVRVGQRVLALNKVRPDLGGPQARFIGLGGPAASRDLEWPKADASVCVPYDEDLYRRCVRGDAIDDQAGTTARPAVEELAGLCLPRTGQAVKVRGPPPR